MFEIKADLCFSEFFESLEEQFSEEVEVYYDVSGDNQGGGRNLLGIEGSPELIVALAAVIIPPLIEFFKKAIELSSNRDKERKASLELKYGDIELKLDCDIQSTDKMQELVEQLIPILNMNKAEVTTK